MPNYDLYDKIVAETLKPLMEQAVKDGGLAVNNYLELEHIKYFIEVGKIACMLTQTQMYVRMKFFSFYLYKLRNRKLMKRVKRYTKKAGKAGITTINVPLIMKNVLEAFGIIDYRGIFVDIYKEYYETK